MSVTTVIRDHRLDTIKTVMIMGIVVEHSMLIYGYPRKHELLWALLISWLMPLFTFISGYLFKERSLKVLADKYLYPMTLFSAVNFLIGYLFYYKYHEGFHIFGYAMWYLWALFWFAIITPPTLRIVSIKIALTLSIIAVVVYQLIPIPSAINYWATKLQFNRIISFYPIFLLGLMIKRNGMLNLVKPLQSRLLFVSTMLAYLLLCNIQEGLAYKSAFYIQPSTGLKTLLMYLLSYLVMMLLCFSLIASMPKSRIFLTNYGSRTLNVYLLHMVVIFPMCYGVFAHISYTPLLAIINSMAACCLCVFFFSDLVERCMKRLLSANKWMITATLYLISLAVVNSSMVFKLIDKCTNF